MNEPPAWATRLMRTVALEHGRLSVPALVWRSARRRRDRAGRHRRPLGTRGDCWYNSIRLFVGTDTQDARGTLLHELAHWLTWDEDAEHGPLFRAVFTGLCRRHRVPSKLRL